MSEEFSGFYANGMGYMLHAGEGEDSFELEVSPELIKETNQGELIFSDSVLEISIFHQEVKDGGYASLNREQAKALIKAINTWLDNAK